MALRPQLLLTREPFRVRATSLCFLIHLSNIGQGEAGAIRYCRRQRFVVRDESVPEKQRILERVYTMAALDLAAHEARECQVLPTEEPWVDEVLGDLELGFAQREFLSVVVFADQAGSLYRLHPHTNVLDTWKPPSRFWLPSPRPAPTWTAWSRE